jgi:hypothetical protein
LLSVHAAALAAQLILNERIVWGTALVCMTTRKPNFPGMWLLA